ncbi:MAG: O-antigen ligase domain-containing protein [Pseudonocardiaceae bacterium]
MGALVALPTASAPDDPAAPPRRVAGIWFLLVINVLGFLPGSSMIIPIPRPAGQAITMGALVAAFGLALVLNPRVRVRPSAYLLLLSLLTTVSIASSLRLESGYGSLFRCFRLTVFVATLWLLSRWWRGDLCFARYHLRALGAVLLSVLAGLIISPGKAFADPDGRLGGTIWPIPATQVGLYCAIVTGLCVVLWMTRNIDGRSAALITLPAVGLLLLSHTRTALLGLLTALLIASLSMAFTNARARRCLTAGIGFGGVVYVTVGQAVQTWLARGEDAEQLSTLTGREKVWDLLLAKHRTLSEQFIGVGLTDKSFAGLPIDDSWLSIYHEQGWVGITLVVAFLGCLLATVALRPPSPARACAVFLIAYCLFASYTEVGLGDASPYLLNLAVAVTLLARAAAGTEPHSATQREGVTKTATTTRLE